MGSFSKNHAASLRYGAAAESQLAGALGEHVLYASTFISTSASAAESQLAGAPSEHVPACLDLSLDLRQLARLRPS